MVPYAILKWGPNRNMPISELNFQLQVREQGEKNRKGTLFPRKQITWLEVSLLECRQENQSKKRDATGGKSGKTVKVAQWLQSEKRIKDHIAPLLHGEKSNNSGYQKAIGLKLFCWEYYFFFPKLSQSFTAEVRGLEGLVHWRRCSKCCQYCDLLLRGLSTFLIEKVNRYYHEFLWIVSYTHIHLYIIYLDILNIRL